MHKIYLAGPITGLSYGDTTDWRKSATAYLREFNLSAVCPMRGKSYLQHEKHIADSYDSADKMLSSKHAISIRDKWDVQTCDAVLMNLLGATKVSIGTMVELGWATAWNKPVIIVMEPGNIHTHAFTEELSYIVVDNIDTGIAVIATLFAGSDY